ncbi:MAG TPA: TlpA disulfide reductase family protein [Pyrinomonadaceae bacterium]|nr:TlpA disulfide reductase family protein [Pyrinomonadaceae bacterium]
MKKFYIILIIAFASVFALAQENKKTVEPVKLEGQIVCCADCWAEADRTKVEFGTAEDLLKAKSCVEGGDPTLLAVREGDKFTLYQLEQGKFRLTEKNWLSYVGKKVSVTGTKQKKKKADVFVVDSLEVIAPSIAEREAREAIGRDVELKLKDLFGTEQTLSQYKGRIIILNFWATYCEPCRKEMPDLAAIQNEYAALGLQVIGASTDEAADRPKVLQFIKETKVNFPIWMGATAADMTRFGLGEALPGTVVIDKNGKIVKVISGVVNVTDLKKQIDSMLSAAESKIKKSETIARENVKEKPKQASSVPS